MCEDENIKPELRAVVLSDPTIAKTGRYVGS
jgi:hypothetical protein